MGIYVSDRGFVWRKLKVKRLPNDTIERLRNITQADLEKTLSVVAQFEVVDGELIPTAPAQNLNEKKGVRQKDGLIQFGLTSYEIKRVYSRLKKLLQRVDSGKIKTFDSEANLSTSSKPPSFQAVHSIVQRAIFNPDSY